MDKTTRGDKTKTNRAPQRSQSKQQTSRKHEPFHDTSLDSQLSLYSRCVAHLWLCCSLSGRLMVRRVVSCRVASRCVALSKVETRSTTTIRMYCMYVCMYV